MLYLLLEVAGQQYAVEASRVVEVLPLVQVTVIPRAPTEVAGIFSYRGRPVPLIDLRRLNAAPPGAAEIQHAHHPRGRPRTRRNRAAARHHRRARHRDHAARARRVRGHRLRQPGDALSGRRRHHRPAGSSSGSTCSSCFRRPRGRCSSRHRPSARHGPAEIVQLLRETIGLDADSIGRGVVERAILDRQAAAGAGRRDRVPARASAHRRRNCRRSSRRWSCPRPGSSAIPGRSTRSRPSCGTARCRWRPSRCAC